jgi:transposase-like protein
LPEPPKPQGARSRHEEESRKKARADDGDERRDAAADAAAHLAVDATKNGLLAFVQQMGLAVLDELLATEAEMIAGPKGKQARGRTHHHWGSARTPIAFGGRNTIIERPRVRVRGKRKGEVELPSIAALRDGDPMSTRVAEQIVLGVSTRGYDRSLEEVDDELETRGTSKSNVSRALIAKTHEKLAEFVSRKLDEVDVVAMFIDGIEFAGHAVIIALGVTIDGTKVPLGIWAGSTENHVVATALLQNLLERGLRVEQSMLFAIDGGKGLRKALRDVFGNRAIVQRCQVHKLRNVKGHLSEARRAYVARQMRDAYKSATAATAKKKLLQLVFPQQQAGDLAVSERRREDDRVSGTTDERELPVVE